METTNPFAIDHSLVPDAGGYGVFAHMDDGDVLCRACVVDPTNPITDAREMWDPPNDGWSVVGFDHTGNLEEPEHCAHCNKEIC